MNIENGWCFLTADFSLKAAGKSETGHVMLVRDMVNRMKWHKQDNDIIESEDCPALHVAGKGVTIEEAIVNANLSAAQASPIKT